MGRPRLIETPDKLWELFNDYKQTTKADPFLVHDFVGKDGFPVYRERQRCLTMEGFENYVADIPGMPMDLGHYFSNSNDQYNEFCTICTRIKRLIRQDQIEGGMAGVYNTSITQRLNGLVDKSEQRVIKEQPLFGDEENE